MEQVGRALADAVEAALPGWVERSVARVLAAHRGSADTETLEAAADAGQRASADLVPRIRSLLLADIDEQTTTPLAIVRDAVPYPTAVLRAAGVAPVRRDHFAEQAFPEDAYDLTPASWADVDPSLVEPALAWGAAKAMAHRRRHGPTGSG